MKRQRFYLLHILCSKHGYPFEWKSAKLHDWPIMGNQLFCTMDNFVLLSVPGLSSIPAAVCLRHRDQRISPVVPEKLGTLSDPVTTRSDKHGCGKPMLTDPDKQVTGNRETAYEHFFQTRCTRRIQRKAFLIGYSPSQLIWRTWRYMCPHISVKKRTQIRKVMLQKWGFTNGSTVFLLTSAKTERDLFHEQKRLAQK